MAYPRTIEYGTYPWLVQEVGAALGYGPNDATWGRDQRKIVDSVIQSGYMQMLYPPPLGAPREGAPAPKPHQWSFLAPLAKLALASGESEYRLPEDFSGVVGDMTIAGCRVTLVPDVRLRQMSKSETGAPKYAATRPLASDGTGRQGYEIAFYPTPDADMDLSFRYSVVPETLSIDRPYPLGGRQYAELLLQSCLSVAEQRTKGEAGVATGRYIERLAAAVQLDVQSLAAEEDLAWAVDDADDGTLDLSYLERLVGRQMGYGPNPAVWTHSQSREVGEAIRAGLRRFYTPPILPGERNAYQWSFLRPLGAITTQAGVWEYDLPVDFAMIDGPLTYHPDTSVLYNSIPVVSEHQVRANRQRIQYDSRPEQAAIAVASVDGETRWKVHFWPTPDGEYTIEFRYKTNPGLLSASKAVPLGGVPHVQTIIESCLSAADSAMGVKNSPHEARYQELLRASVSNDRISGTADTLGHNYDTSDLVFSDNYRDGVAHVVTYNGVAY